MANQGPFTRLSRPPRRSGKPEYDAFELAKWFDRVWYILSGIPGIGWAIVSKVGSKLSEIEEIWVPVHVAADYTAAAFQHISVTCSTVDVTITLPAAADNIGLPIWIHKVDATAFAVLTSVKDIAYQGSTMHLISNGTDWVIS